MKLFAAALALTACACSNSAPKGEQVMNDTASDDSQLIERVRAATKQTVDPKTVEQQVGQKALVNTTTGLPLEALRRVELVADPDHPKETLELDTAKVVVYWKRPIERANPHVVGLQVDGAGAASVFFAVILPP